VLAVLVPGQRIRRGFAGNILRTRTKAGASAPTLPSTIGVPMWPGSNLHFRFRKLGGRVASGVHLARPLREQDGAQTEDATVNEWHLLGRMVRPFVVHFCRRQQLSASPGVDELPQALQAGDPSRSWEQIWGSPVSYLIFFIQARIGPDTL